MRFAHLKIAVLLPFLCLAACVTPIPRHAYLPDAARDKIASTDVVVPIKQAEIYVFVPVATAGQSNGLLGALIDAGIDDVRTSKAEKAVKPLRDSLVDFDFDELLRSDIGNSLAPVPLIHAGKPRVVKDASIDSMNRILAASKADAVLFAVADYQLSNDADVLQITLVTSLFPHNDALRLLHQGKSGKTPAAPENALYRNTIVFVAKVAHATDDRDHNIALLCANKGAATRALLQVGTAKLATMLADDIQRHGTLALNGAQTSAEGAFIKKDAGGELQRYDDGTLMYRAN